jgi:hypothetical protein
VEHNEWQFRKATWSEIQVINYRSGEEVWISRRYVGEVSRIDDPLLMVGLSRELELSGGMVVPVQRRIIEMPVAVNASIATGMRTAGRNAPAQVVGIRLERRDRRIFKLILIAVAALAVLYSVAISLARLGELRQKKPSACSSQPSAFAVCVV